MTDFIFVNKKVFVVIIYTKFLWDDFDLLQLIYNVRMNK